MTTRAIDRCATIVRPATHEDDWAVRELFEALHTFNAGLEPRFALAAGWERLLTDHLARERASGDGRTLLAWAGSEPVGLAMVAGHTDSAMFRQRRWAELTALYAAPWVRGGGVAARLFGAAQEWAQTAGYAELRLYVTATNVRARQFYAGEGLRPLQEVWSTGV